MSEIQEFVALPYQAFVSYSHTADTRLAPAIQLGLQRFAKPWYKISGMRVFRDETNLSVNPGLWTSIENSLRQSECFILLASPRAAESEWVQREVEFWLAHRGSDRLIIALTEGSIQWDRESDDFDWKQTDALPSNLSKIFAEEPKYGDFTWARKGRDLSLSNPRFATEIARLVSAIRGRPLDELIGEDVRQRRRFRAAMGAAFVLIAGLASIAVWQSWVAKTHEQLALSRLLANQSLNQLDEQLDLALLLSVQATDIAPTVDALGSLFTALHHRPELVTYLRGHTREVFAVAISPDGKTAASGDSGGTIILWDLSSRRQTGPAITLSARVSDLAFSPDGRILASANEDHSIALLQLKNREAKIEFLTGHTGPVNSVQFSPDGKLLASGGSDGRIILWDPEMHVASGTLNGTNQRAIFDVAFSPNGSLLAAGGDVGGVWLWDVQSRKEKLPRLSGHTNGVSEVAFSADSLRLVTTNFDHTVIVHDLVTNKALGPPLTGHTNIVHAAAFSPDGKFLLTGDSDGLLLLRDADTLRQVAPPWKASRGVSSVVFSPDGNTILSGNWDGTLVLWEIDRSEKLAGLLTGHRDGVSSVAFSPDGRLLVSGSYDKSVIVWDFASRQPLSHPLTQLQSPVLDVTFSPDGSSFSTKDGRKRIIVWDTERQIPIAHQPTDRKALSDAVFTPDGRSLLYGSHVGAILWDLKRGSEIAIGKLPSGTPVVNVACSPDGKLVAISGRSGHIAILDAQSLQPAGESLMGHSGSVLNLGFSADGKVLVSAGEEGSIVLWSMSERREIWRATAAHGKEPLSVVFGPDGKLIASGGADGKIILWDSHTGQSIGTPIRAHRGGGVDALAFSPDGKVLASAGRGGVIKLWDVALRAWKARACDVVRRDLTEAEWHRYLGDRPQRDTCSFP